MATVTLDTGFLAVLTTVFVLLEITFFWMWQYFYGEKTKIELQKGLNSFKSMPATVKKQFKQAMKEELETIDWSEVLPEYSESQGLLQTLLANLDQVVGLWEYIRQQKGMLGEMKEGWDEATKELKGKRAPPKKEE